MAGRGGITAFDLGLKKTKSGASVVIFEAVKYSVSMGMKPSRLRKN